jgi:hypothetical protein
MRIRKIIGRALPTALHAIVALLVVATVAIVLVGGTAAALGDDRLLTAARVAIGFDLAALLLLGLFLEDRKPVLFQWWSAARAHFYPHA